MRGPGRWLTLALTITSCGRAWGPWLEGRPSSADGQQISDGAEVILTEGWTLDGAGCGTWFDVCEDRKGGVCFKRALTSPSFTVPARCPEKCMDSMSECPWACSLSKTLAPLESDKPLAHRLGLGPVELVLRGTPMLHKEYFAASQTYTEHLDVDLVQGTGSQSQILATFSGRTTSMQPETPETIWRNSDTGAAGALAVIQRAVGSTSEEKPQVALRFTIRPECPGLFDTQFGILAIKDEYKSIPFVLQSLMLKPYAAVGGST